MLVAPLAGYFSERAGSRLFMVAGLALQAVALAWLAAIVMLFAGQRDLLGHDFFMVLMAYKVHTWAALMALALVLSLRSSDAQSIPRPHGLS